jgi:nitrogen regulatory protein PII
MKMVTAYVERESFEPIREELLSLGFRSLSAWEVNGSIPEPTVTGSYRGSAVETHLRPKIRIECVAGSSQATTIVETVLKHAGDRRFVVVSSIDEAFPNDTVKVDPALAAAD